MFLSEMYQRAYRQITATMYCSGDTVHIVFSTYPTDGYDASYRRVYIRKLNSPSLLRLQSAIWRHADRHLPENAHLDISISSFGWIYCHALNPDETKGEDDVSR